MKNEQLRFILEPTSIESLIGENADVETLADAMLLNWEKEGSLLYNDYWRIVFELHEFYWDDILIDADYYKNIQYRQRILKIRDRYFAYNYSEGYFDVEGEDFVEVKPIPRVSYEVDYVGLNDTRTKDVYCSHCYDKLFGNPVQ